MRRRARRLGLLAILLLAVLAGGFVWFLRLAAMPPQDPGRETDGIAVLTGGGDRVETALRLLAEGRARQLLISGAHRDASFADIARAVGRDPAPLEDRVVVARAAATTRGNAAEIAAWARAHDVGSIRVVTAGYHMPRAMLELRRALPREERVPHPVMPSRLREPGATLRLRTWSLLVGEYLKWLVARTGLSAFTWARHESR